MIVHTTYYHVIINWQIFISVDSWDIQISIQRMGYGYGIHV